MNEVTSPGNQVAWIHRAGRVAEERRKNNEGRRKRVLAPTPTEMRKRITTPMKRREKMAKVHTFGVPTSDFKKSSRSRSVSLYAKKTN